jgi:hypothetical protein
MCYILHNNFKFFKLNFKKFSVLILFGNCEKYIINFKYRLIDFLILKIFILIQLINYLRLDRIIIYLHFEILL